MDESTRFEEASEVVHIFWEWRDKLLGRYFVGMGGMAALYTWLVGQASNLMWVPFALGSLLSLMLGVIHLRQTAILRRAVEICVSLEVPPGIYAFIGAKNPRPSLGELLTAIYFGSTVILGALALVIRGGWL